MTCPTCDKGDRAKLYCRRQACGLVPSAVLGTQAPPHTKYNAVLQQLRDHAGWMDELASQAYAVAQSEASPGPRSALLNIADAASRFSSLVKTAKSL